MAQILVRNIEDAVKERLRDRAREHGRSLEEEVRDILRSAATAPAADGGVGTEIAAIIREAGGPFPEFETPRDWNWTLPGLEDADPIDR
jgi:plasmid stability protein